MAPREITPPNTTKEIGPRRDAAKTVRDNLKTALGQEGLTDAEYAAISKQYEAAKKQYNLLDDLYGKAKDKEGKLGREQKLKQIADEETKRIIGIAEQKAIDKAKSFSDDPNNPNKKGLRDTAYSELNKLYDQADAKFVKLPRIIAPIDGGGFGLVNPAAPPTDGTTVSSAPGASSNRQQAAGAAREGGTPVTDAPVGDKPVPTDSTAVSRQSASNQKAYVDAQLKAKGLADTPANRKTLRAAYQALTPEEKTAATSGATPLSGAKPVSDTAWLDEFAKTYTAYADWTTQNVVDHFGADFVQVLKDAVANNYTVDEIQAKIKGTAYFGTVSENQYKFDGYDAPKQKELIASARRSITSDYADAGLSETDLTELARTVARSGLTGTGLKQAVYQYSLRKTSMATDFTNPITAKNALQGADADAIRQAAKAYGYLVSDAEVQAALTGGMYNGVTSSKDSIVQKAQRVAKGQYQQLSDQIDAGASLDDIFANYKNYAARTLELDPGKVDFVNDPKWQIAFGTKDTGQMSLTDWVTKLKSDPTFGYQHTQQANQDATSIGLSIAKAFGKVK